MKRISELFLVVFLVLISNTINGQESVAREWNEELLEAIRDDFARPTVHARNLFHTSIAMYDAWAAYDDTATPYLLGKTVRGFKCEFDGIPTPTDIEAAREEAISYAAYRLLLHRFLNSPNFNITSTALRQKLIELGYDPAYNSTDYSNGVPAALGNYIASCIISYGLQDGSNEAGQYENTVYLPVNEPLAPDFPGNPDITDPNRWQPLTLEVFIDQSGEIFEGETPDFLSPEWGQVIPFAMNNSDVTSYIRDEFEYKVYNDPGRPPMLEFEDTEAYLPDEYLWGFSLVSVWGSHLDPSDGVMWDISPGSIGNISSLPQSFEEYRNFYDLLEGGDPSQGRTVNPATGQPYPQQMVPRADYARVLAEFWADGPDSETPPGHWFTILNYVSDHPMLEKRFEGQGDVLDDLEWDVKSYFALGGAMHDAAISAWGIKGYYDYIRPISAIRYMASMGQSTDENLDNYDPHGIPLIEGLIEVVEEGDPLAGTNNFNVGKIKLYSWKGPDFISDPETDVAGVDWILADNWWPYQRPTFITPPFAGFVSGHSTYSRAAAEVMTLLTGDEYFPGGVGEFIAEQNEFLVFEEGPSVDVVLQWATYRDASDQTSLSRIWGGIHPPADDIPGRLIGEKIGVEGFSKAKEYYEGIITGVEDRLIAQDEFQVYPNPITGNQLQIKMKLSEKISRIELIDLTGREVITQEYPSPVFDASVNTQGLTPGIYTIRISGNNWTGTQKVLVQ